MGIITVEKETEAETETRLLVDEQVNTKPCHEGADRSTTNGLQEIRQPMFRGYVLRLTMAALCLRSKSMKHIRPQAVIMSQFPKNAGTRRLGRKRTSLTPTEIPPSNDKVAIPTA